LCQDDKGRRFPLNQGDKTDFFEAGINLFNDGRFFECHEAWEQIWTRSTGEEKLFYQGIIQAAVAILHAQRGNLIGAASLYSKASAKLDHLPSEHMGIALGELRDALKEFFAIALSGEPVPVPPKLRRI
jgi:predicted metal-dependent hydrolase